MLQYLDTIIAFVVILLGVSLLITILNQMISALLGYRGTNLLWGIQKLLSTIAPDLSKKDSSNSKLPTQAEKIATEVLRKPVISDSLFSKFAKDSSVLGWLTKRWKLATAITPQELVRGLSNVAQTLAATKDGTTTADMINQVLNQVNPEAERNAKMVLDILQKVSPGITNQMDKLVQELGTKMQGSVGKLEASFDTVMKRTSQRFALQMRIWTIIFAIVIAFGAHLDSFKIIEQLWTSPELRASLVSDRETILKEASVVLSVQSGTAQAAGPGVPPQILGDAMKNLINVEKEAAAGLGAPPEFNNPDQAVDWLRKNLKGDQSFKEKLAGEYRNLVLTELSAHADKIKKDLAKAGFQIQIGKSWKDFIKLFEGLSILGILVTAGLLSLGAPFWFNALKSLSNLRPLVANSSAKTATELTQS
jgi:hypothetical protein